MRPLGLRIYKHTDRHKKHQNALTSYASFLNEESEVSRSSIEIAGGASDAVVAFRFAFCFALDDGEELGFLRGVSVVTPNDSVKAAVDWSTEANPQGTVDALV